jgi:RHS repeat-associated protein
MLLRNGGFRVDYLGHSHRLLSRTDPDGTAISYTYDAAGNRLSVTIPAGTTSYTFDAMNRTETVTDPEGGVTKYTYDADGELIKTEFPNGTSELRQYDVVNHLTYLENDGPTGIISSYKYTLAKTGRRDAVTEDTGRKVQYQYDALDRLIEEFITEADGTTTRKIDYTYDPVGNRKTMVDTAQGETDYTYDNNDRLLTETLAGVQTKYTYDNNGNTLTKFTSAVDQAIYEWDAQNRMVGATVTDSTGTSNIIYRYDADGIRVSSKVNGEETRFLIDTVQPYAQVLEEYTPGGVIKVSYVYGNDLISQNRSGAKSFYVVDALGSTRALTNASGVVTDRYFYDAFGNLIGQSGSATNSYLFAGEERDIATGAYYLRSRYLDTSRGAFLSKDTFAASMITPISLNRYLYANANPSNLTDPSGEIGMESVIAFLDFAALSLSPILFAGNVVSSLLHPGIDITVYLPKNRDHKGIMMVTVGPGFTWFAQALGRGASRAQLQWWKVGGNTPTGEYTGTYSSRTESYSGIPLGPNGNIALEPTKGGDDHADQAYGRWGRSGLLIHGGGDLQQQNSSNEEWFPLKPTNGCIRILDSDMYLLALFAKRAKRISVSVLGPQEEAP